MQGRPNSFLTLTSRRDHKKTPNDAARELARAWRLLRLRILRKLNISKLPFLAVFERTKLGWPHLHIIMRAPYISQTWISVQMRDLTGSFIVDIRRIDGQRGAIGYVTKYVGKDAHRFGSAKRYWESQDYQIDKRAKIKASFEHGFGWDRDTRHIDKWCRSWREVGHIVTMTSRWKASARPPPSVWAAFERPT